MCPANQLCQLCQLQFQFQFQFLFLKYTSKQTTKQYIYYIYFYNQIKWKVDTEDTEQTKEKLKTDRKLTKKAEM